MPYRVAIFARNEAQNITATLDSVRQTLSPEDDANLEIRVMINGCSDNTAQVVRRYAAEEHPGVLGIELPIGDKCNAWNAYLHDHAEPHLGHDDVHFFIDGDVGASPAALPRMRRRLLEHPHAYAIAGAPMNGRSREWINQIMLERHWVFGGLYAVRGSHLRRLRDHDVRLPLGLCGNDHMITRLLKTRFPDVYDTSDQRVLVQTESGFTFSSLQPWRMDDVRLHLRRRTTYALRQEQLKRIGEHPLDDLPETMDEINREILADLHRRVLPLWSPLMKVRDRLERMYPQDQSHYTAMLTDAA